MAFTTRSLSPWATLLLSLLAATRSAALSQEYCATDNTGSSSSSHSSIYMSNGLCSTTCSGYAFAIVQYKNCWCSNYAPGDQVDVSSCNQNCPGYPQEQCGNQNAGYFGYVALNNAPSGTAAGSAATTSSSSITTTQSSTTSASPKTSSTTTTPSPVTETATATEVVTPSSTTSNPPVTVTSTVTKAPTTSEAPTTTPSTTATPTMVTNTQVVTISGAVVTQTVTSLPQPQSTAGSVQESPTTQKSKSNTGAIVGGVVGGLAALLLLFALLFFFLRRRKNQTPTTARKLDRNASILSKAGLLGAGHARDPEKSMDEPNYGAQRHSVLYNDPEGSPISSPEGVYDRSSSFGRRNSKPLVYDQRLNPAALMENWQHNGSRSSINTMQDQRDYSRPLGITNPDPE
ncbi:WSC-domain-containing protein [Myriangium duriaei CBS 260.36]|uniref:WSC-domain-containing protein n=1 Tax=Myriangium duriaei CBS 260.36 TaxID=1168546 RepID=A0A9P4J1H8_9PEZI|nr:WSC-domain-containing protein [Myriangium duriaei CBS 260.36]